MLKGNSYSKKKKKEKRKRESKVKGRRFRNGGGRRGGWRGLTVY